MSDLWTQLGEELLSAAVETLRGRASDAIVRLLVLIVTEERRQDHLKSIERKLDAMTESHFLIGLRHLEEMKTARDPGLRLQLLHDARRAFSNAVTVDGLFDRPRPHDWSVSATICLARRTMRLPDTRKLSNARSVATTIF